MGHNKYEELADWFSGNWFYIIIVVISISLCAMFRFGFLQSRHTDIVFEPIMTQEEFYKAYPSMATEFGYATYKNNEILRRMD